MNSAMTWDQICDDPHLRDLPYKIEQDRHGRIVMSPAKYDHGRYQGEIAKMLGLLLPGWAIPIECGIETSEGVKVSDVAAMTRDRDRRYRGVASIPEAPDICIEVLSWSNTPEEMDEKLRLYAAKGCLEFWTCSEDGKMTFFDAATGQTLPQSGLCPAFPPLIRLE